MFEAGVDKEIRDLLMTEFFNNVCRKYCRLQIMIFEMARNQIKPLLE